MADSSDVKNNENADTSNSAGDTAQEEENKPRVMKRGRTGMISSSTDNSEDSEPEEKRPAFRLQPPTLIHGKAKPVPKPEDSGSGSNSSKCKFLQPSKLSAISSSTSTSKAPVPMNDQVAAEPEPLVSSSNPFLMAVEKNPNEEAAENETDSSDQMAKDNDSTNTEEVNQNGTDDLKPDSTTDVDASDKDEPKESVQENLFSQASSSTSAKEPGIGGFVFGSKMEDRVVMNNESKSPDKAQEEDASSSSGGFVFGQNLSERAKVSSSTDSNPSFLPTSNEVTNSVDSSSVVVEPSQDAASHSPSSSDKKQTFGLIEDAAAHFLASQSRPVMPEVEVVTGEEDEKSVLQMQCKLHQFDAADQNWLERGVGSLHLNDGKYSDDNLHFQSRLVMRVHGSLRLVLNTKIWPQMTVERASNKSVRVSAQTDDGTIGVFLITATINDAEQVFRALEYRVLHQKQLEEKRMEIERKKKGITKNPEEEKSENDKKEPEQRKSDQVSNSHNSDDKCNANNEKDDAKVTDVKSSPSKQDDIDGSKETELNNSTPPASGAPL